MKFIKIGKETGKCYKVTVISRFIVAGVIALYRTLSSIKQKFQIGVWPKCFIQDIVQYKAKVYTTPFINAVKLPIAV